MKTSCARCDVVDHVVGLAPPVEGDLDVLLAPFSGDGRHDVLGGAVKAVQGREAGADCGHDGVAVRLARLDLGLDLVDDLSGEGVDGVGEVTVLGAEGDGAHAVMLRAQLDVGGCGEPDGAGLLHDVEDGVVLKRLRRRLLDGLLGRLLLGLRLLWGGGLPATGGDAKAEDRDEEEGKDALAHGWLPRTE